jgi:hypothetical protein
MISKIISSKFETNIHLLTTGMASLAIITCRILSHREIENVTFVKQVASSLPVMDPMMATRSSNADDLLVFKRYLF